MLNQHDSSNNVGKKGWQCEICQRVVQRKSNLVRHYKHVHKQVYLDRSTKTKHKCLHPECKEVFYHRTRLIAHCKNVHNVECETEELSFDDINDFFKWKIEEESGSFSYFSRRSAVKDFQSVRVYYFVCQHDGDAAPHVKKSELEQKTKQRDLKRNKKGRVRTGNVCPARMKVRQNKISGGSLCTLCKIP